MGVKISGFVIDGTKLDLVNSNEGKTNFFHCKAVLWGNLGHRPKRGPLSDVRALFHVLAQDFSPSSHRLFPPLIFPQPPSPRPPSLPPRLPANSLTMPPLPPQPRPSTPSPHTSSATPATDDEHAAVPLRPSLTPPARPSSSPNLIAGRINSGHMSVHCWCWTIVI